MLGSFQLQGTSPGINIIPFSILSIIITLILVGGGYAGGRIFFIVALPFHVFGLLFMLISASAGASDGFAMLAAFIMYMFATGFGFILGLVIQMILRLKSKK